MKSESNNYFHLLSKREKEVLALMMKGEKNKDISAILFLKPNTVSTYKKLIFKKLKVNNLIELYKINHEM